MSFSDFFLAKDLLPDWSDSGVGFYFGSERSQRCRPATSWASASAHRSHVIPPSDVAAQDGHRWCHALLHLWCCQHPAAFQLRPLEGPVVFTRRRVTTGLRRHSSSGWALDTLEGARHVQQGAGGLGRHVLWCITGEHEVVQKEQAQEEFGMLLSCEASCYLVKRIDQKRGRTAHHRTCGWILLVFAECLLVVWL